MTAMTARNCPCVDQKVARSACDSQSTRLPRKPNSDTSISAMAADRADDATMVGQNGRV